MNPPVGCLHARSSETTSSSRNAAFPANGGGRASGGAGGGTFGGARPTTHSQGSTWELGRALRAAKTACAASRMIAADALARLKHLGGGRRISLGAAPQEDAQIFQGSNTPSLLAAPARGRLVLRAEVVAAPDQILPADAHDDLARPPHRLVVVQAGRAQAG